MREYRLISTTPILGYGFPEAALIAGLERNPDVIGCDAGSTDPGPYYLGAGEAFSPTMSIKRDLTIMLKHAVPRGIPVVISSCGGSGGKPHLEATAKLVREIAKEMGLHFRLALIHAEQDKTLITKRIKENRVRPLASGSDLETSTVERAHRIVGMMGPEPFAKALDEGAQVILAGRASDPAPWAACAMRAQLPPAQAWYAGKMLECGGESALPRKDDCLFVTVRDDGVELEPLSPERACTPFSVANFSLHENSSPIYHVEPGGLLDTSDCRFEAATERSVRVSGMKWTPAEHYTVKLEGVELVGYRSIAICGARDPILIPILGEYLEGVRKTVAEKTKAYGVSPDSYKLLYHVYGQNGVMGEREPVKKSRSHEMGIVIEVVAQTRELAKTVIATARTTTLHSEFAGRLCKEGNMAIPFSPSDIEAGPVYRFSIFHTVQPDNPLEMFPIEYESV